MSNRITINWNLSIDEVNEISVIKFSEENDDLIRDRYNNFIDDLGYKNLGNKNFHKHFDIYKGYNLWWMSLIFEKSNYKSEGPNNSIKLLAIEEIIKRNKPIEIYFICDDTKIIKAVKILCTNLNINLSIIRTKKKLDISFKRLVPYIFIVLMYSVKFYVQRRPFKNIKKNRLLDKKYDVIFFSYLNGLLKKNEKVEIDYSSQFGNLPKLLKEFGFTSYWISHFVPNYKNYNPKKVSEIINQSNINENNDFHDLLDSFLNIKIIIQSIKIYLDIYFKFLFKKRIKDLFVVENSALSLWPVLKEDLNKSIFGVVSFINIIYSLQIDRFLSSIPSQKYLIYLMENQGWERALLHGWKLHKHDTIIAYQYGIFRYWDLRYYTTTNKRKDIDFTDIPKPNYIASSGQIANQLFLEMGYSENELINVENLRYNSLFNPNYQLKKNIINQDQFKSTNSNLKIIVLFDIDMKINYQLINIINNLNFKKYDIIWYAKFHAGKNFALKKLIEKKINIISGKLHNVLKEYDLALTVSNSGSSIDAYILKVPLIIYKNSSNIDFSPFKNFDKSISFIKNENELQEFLLSYKSDVLNKNYSDKFFWHNEDLMKWRTLLKKLK